MEEDRLINNWLYGTIIEHNRFAFYDGSWQHFGNKKSDSPKHMDNCSN
jgi:3-mercaptopyruvate sulfurtransferase SseA